MKVNRYYRDQLRSVLYQLIDASKLMPPKDQAEFRGLWQDLGALADTVESFEERLCGISEVK